MSARTVFMFPGQGSQYYQMGRRLLETEPVFRETLEELDAQVEPALGASAVGHLYAPDRSSADPFLETAVSHPALVMVELAIARTLMSRGVLPDVLLGASLGEFTAAALAGAVDTGDCLRALVSTARTTEGAEPGGMLAVVADPGLYLRERALYDGLELAGLYHHELFVVSGPLERLEEAEGFLGRQGVLCQRVPVAYAFHSRLMDPSRDRFERVWAGVRLSPPRIELISCATAAPAPEVTMDSLWRAVREPIDFSGAIAGLERGGGEHLYLDLGPSGTLDGSVRALLAASPRARSRSLATLTRFPQDALPLDRIHAATGRAGEQRSRLPSPARTEGDALRVWGFPGQGAQVKGMGAELFREFPEHVAEADEVMGYSIRELCLENPDRRLRLTRYAQPALFVVGALSCLKRSQEVPTPPDYLVGHSLGEYVALFAAGAFGFADGLNLVRHRGELMGRAVGGTMAAVLGWDAARVEDLREAAGLTEVDIANYNAPRETVLAGPVADIERAKQLFEARGAKVVMLNVSAAFHSRAMRGLAEEFATVLEATEVRAPRVPVIANVNALPYEPNLVRETLVRQLYSPVRWTDSVGYLLDQGDFVFEEPGPGRVLTKLVHRIRESRLPTAPVSVPGPATAPVSVPGPATALAPIPGPVIAAFPEPGPATTAPACPPSPPAVTAMSPGPPRRRAEPRGPRPEQLGAATFRERYGLRCAYLAGALYGGVSSGELVARLAGAGYLGFLGIGGMDLGRVERELDALRTRLGSSAPYGVSLPHRHHEPALEEAVVDLLLRYGVRVVEASGFLRVTPALVKYRLKGGRIIAKVSRTESAEALLRPPPADLVRELLDRGEVSEPESTRGAGLPVADDLCVEAEGGWQPTGIGTATLLPAVLALRDAHAGPGPRVHVGVAGGIGTPHAAAAAFALGAEFIVTGSVNQCTVEAATSVQVKGLLQRLDVGDTGSVPSADALELGVRHQVAKRGLLLPSRADHLYRLWQEYDAYEEIRPATRRRIEEVYLRHFPEVRAALLDGSGSPVAEDATLASEGPGGSKHRLALLLRSYLDHGFRLALAGDPDRRTDYLVHCGPAMGAFNRWVRGTELEPWQARRVDVLAERLLQGTAELLRRQRFPSAADGADGHGV